MTEKRFTIAHGFKIVAIRDNGEIMNSIRVCELLNQLSDENEQLKQSYKEFEDECQSTFNAMSRKQNDLYRKNFKLKEENEQLKQFQDRVFSWIDMHLQRLPTLRDDEFESDNEFADPSLYSGAIQILETMKIELKGDMND